jgi:hypothetical protein
MQSDVIEDTASAEKDTPAEEGEVEPNDQIVDEDCTAANDPDEQIEEQLPANQSEMQSQSEKGS